MSFLSVMRLTLLFVFICVGFNVVAQKNPYEPYKIEKENLTSKVRLYWDASNKRLQATGSYYKNDFLFRSAEKHGKWLFYSYEGILEEERSYYRNRLLGKQTIFFPDKSVKSVAYFFFNVPDSIYKEYNPQGKLIISGKYLMGSPEGKWEYFYDDGRPHKVEFVKEDTVYLQQFWASDSAHTQLIKNGNGVLTSYYINGVTKEFYTFKDGLKNGPFQERTANGVLSVAGNFLNGKKDGEWDFYHIDGVQDKKLGYKNDSLHGVYEVYYRDGTVNTKGAYNNGKKTGFWEWRTEKGILEMSGSFLEDQQDGHWIYNYPSGQLSYNAYFEKGKRSGEWSYFYEGGEPFKKGKYVNNDREGIWETRYENGNLLLSGAYKNGKEEGDWFNYWEDGKLKNKSSFKQGRLHGKWYSYLPNGVLSLTGTYKNGLKTGEWQEFYSNGRKKEITNYKIKKIKNYSNDVVILGMKQITSVPHGKFEAYSHLDFQLKGKGTYKNGLKHGTWIDFYPGGEIPTVVSPYKDGKLHGKYKQYSRTGKLQHEISYQKGLKHGPFIMYDKDGKEIVNKMFRYGREMQKLEKPMFTP